MPHDFNITDARRGAAFTAVIIPEAEAVGVTGLVADNTLEITLTEPLAGGRADAQLIAFLAEALDVAPDQVTIVAGHDRPKKIISVDGIPPSLIEQRLLA